MFYNVGIKNKYMNKNTKLIWLVIVALIVVVGIAFAVNDGKGKDEDSEKIKVGVILPLSGEYGTAFGEAVRNSIEMSVNDLQIKNVEIVYEDGGFDTAKVLSAYNKLQSFDDVDIVIGLDSPTLEAIKPIINKTDELMLTIGNEASIEKDNVFEVIPWATALFKDLGKAVSGKYEKVAIVYASDWALAAPNKAQFIEGLGHKNYIEIPIASNSDMRTEVSKLLQEDVDAYTVFLPIEQGSKLINEIARQGGSKKLQMICDGNIELTIGDFLDKVADDSAFNDCLSTMIADTTEKDYVERYKQIYGAEPNFLGVYGYDAIQIISKSLAKEDKSEWKDMLEKSVFSFKGISGDITFDKTGSRTLVSDVKIFKDGKFIKLENQSN